MRLRHVAGYVSHADMGTFEKIDLMARGGSLAFLALWSWILLRDHRGVLAARLAVLMNIAIGCYLIVTAGSAFRFTPVRPVLAIIAGSTPGTFWLFAKAWFNDEKRVDWVGVALVALAAANMWITQITVVGSIIHTASAIIFRVGMLAFAIAGLREAGRGRREDLVEGRRRLRPRITATVGAYVIVIVCAEVAVFNNLAPRWVIGVVGSSIAIVVLLFCAAMFGMRQPDLFGPTAEPAKTGGAKSFNDDALAEKLRDHMQRELAWRDEGLSIAALASQLGEQEYRLRRVINQQLGHRNFAAFLNGYRLAEVKQALGDPAQKDVPIITIALDAGFGSLGPFNRAFREAEGITPSEYRAQHAG